MRTAKPSSLRKKKQLDDREGGTSGPPSFSRSRVPIFKCSRGPSLLDGQRPAVPSGLKLARQLMAAVPIAREGWRGSRFAFRGKACSNFLNRPALRSARSMRAQGFASAAVAPSPRSANGAARLPNGSARYLPCCRSGWRSLPRDSRSCCDRSAAALVGIYAQPKAIAAVDDAAALVVADRWNRLKVTGLRAVRAYSRAARLFG